MKKIYPYQNLHLLQKATQQLQKLFKSGRFQRLTYKKRMQWRRRILDLKEQVQSFNQINSVKKVVTAVSITLGMLLSNNVQAQFEAKDAKMFFRNEIDYIHALVDIDNDGDYDGLINNTILINSGTKEAATFLGESITIENISGNIKQFADIDNDGDQDLFTVDENEILFYRNVAYEFSLEDATQFGLNNQEGTQELAIADLDNDGDLDIITTNFSNLNNYDVAFFYFENIGTATQPIFSAGVENPFGLTPIDLDIEGFWNIDRIYLVDIDIDGDLDLISYWTGYDSPVLKFHENIGDINAPNFELPTHFLNINDGWANADMDNDGDIDYFGTKRSLLSGSNFSFFENKTINVNTPPRSNRAVIEVHKDSVYVFDKKDFPFFEADSVDTFHHLSIFVKSNNGVFKFRGKKLEKENRLIWLSDGFSDEIILTDDIHELTYLNTTGKEEVFQFKVSDGKDYSIIYTFTILVHENPFRTVVNLKLLPNPAQNAVTFQVKSEVEKPAVIVIQDASGKIINEFAIELAAEVTLPIDIQHLMKGVYFVTLSTADGEVLTEKLVVNN